MGWGLMCPGLGLEQEMPDCWGMWALQDGQERMQSTLHSQMEGNGQRRASLPAFSIQSCSPQEFISICLFSAGNNLLPLSPFSALQVSRGLRPHGHQEQRTSTVTVHERLFTGMAEGTGFGNVTRAQALPKALDPGKANRDKEQDCPRCCGFHPCTESLQI